MRTGRKGGRNEGIRRGRKEGRQKGRKELEEEGRRMVAGTEGKKLKEGRKVKE